MISVFLTNLRNNIQNFFSKGKANIILNVILFWIMKNAQRLS